MVRIKFFRFLVIVLLVLSVLTGCSDDDEGDIGDHVTPWGFALYDSGVEVARYFQGQLSTNSLIEVPDDGMSGHILIHWIDADSVEFNPLNRPELNEGHHHLELIVQNENVAGIFRHEGVDEVEDWAFHITGLAEGTTGLHVALRHVDHYGFKMPDQVWVPIEIVHGSGENHGPPVGLVIMEESDGNVLVTVNASGVTGGLTVAAGNNTGHLEVEFFDSNGVHFQPDVPPHSLAGEVDHTALAEFESHAADGEPWTFQINGLQTGSTTLVLKLMHDQVVGYEAAPITIHVQ